VSLSLAIGIVTLLAIFTNRILAVGAGLWFRVPDLLLLTLLLVLDFIQMPFFFRLYEQGSSTLARLPSPLRKYFQRDWSGSYLGKWTAHFGGVGVMLVAAMPTFGGGIWSGTFLAYGLGLKRRASYTWLILGSLFSYLALYWILDTLIRTFRYFWR
jgi:uncharacterized membrane protein